MYISILPLRGPLFSLSSSSHFYLLCPFPLFIFCSFRSHCKNSALFLISLFPLSIHTHTPIHIVNIIVCLISRYWQNRFRPEFHSNRLLEPIPLEVTFSKPQSSKLERLFCHVSVKRDVWALSFELWNSVWKCHPKWDWLYQWLVTQCDDRDTW